MLYCSTVLSSSLGAGIRSAGRGSRAPPEAVCMVHNAQLTSAGDKSGTGQFCIMASVEHGGVPLGVKLPAIILASFLSMFFAEVFSGSSPLWFFSGWGLLVTLPLYGGHLLLLINLAMRFRRTSVSSLYLWGILFGLYESWITKVLWAGYIGATPGLGTFFGIGVQEFAVLALFWHPVFSFIIPVLVYETLVAAAGNPGGVLPSHAPFLARRRQNFILAGAALLIGASFLNVGVQTNAPGAVVTILGSVALISLALWLAVRERRGEAAQFGIGSLRLGRRGFSVLVIYIAVLYAVTFPLLLPERIPGLPVIAFTLAIYGAVVALIYLKKPNGEAASPPANGTTFFSIRDLGGLAIALVAATAILSLSPVADFVLFYGFYWGITGAGCFLLAMVMVMILRERLRAR